MCMCTCLSVPPAAANDDDRLERRWPATERHYRRRRYDVRIVSSVDLRRVAVRTVAGLLLLFALLSIIVGDTRDPGGSYGTMQIHNHATGSAQTLIAFNKWNDGNSDVGVGNDNNNDGGQPDWTFSNSFASGLFVAETFAALPALVTTELASANA